jgi:hypothetical protein
MLAALLIFSILVYGLAFLVADAKIFGCPAKSFYDQPEDVAYIREVSILPLRQIFMRWRWCGRVIKSLLTCYFCLGVWCGALIHLALLGLHQLDSSVPLLSSYPLLSCTLWGTLVSTALAAIAGAVSCYLLDLLVQVLENKVAVQTLAIEEAEAVARSRKVGELD